MGRGIYGLFAGRADCELPSGEWLHGAAGWAAVLSCAGNMRFKDHGRIFGMALDRFPWNAAQGNFEPASPVGVVLAGGSSDIEVNEPPVGRPLHIRPEQVWRQPVGTRLCRDDELEAQIFPCRSLLLDGLVSVSPSLLQAEIHVRRGLLDEDAKRQFQIHAALSIFLQAGAAPFTLLLPRAA